MLPALVAHPAQPLRRRLEQALRSGQSVHAGVSALLSPSVETLQRAALLVAGQRSPHPEHLTSYSVVECVAESRVLCAAACANSPASGGPSVPKGSRRDEARC